TTTAAQTPSIVHCSVVERPSTSSGSAKRDETPPASTHHVTPAKATPVIASTIGYRAEIRSPHEAHLPRSTIHPRTGTLCHGLMAVSQCGHLLTPSSDDPAGTR